MADAALRVRRDFDDDIVRRLMARPIRRDVQDRPSRDADGPSLSEADAAGPGTSADLSRLKAEMVVMKAVLSAERSEAAHLRACIEKIADPAPVSPEAQAVRDRWAALVDQLLEMPR